MNRLVVYSGTLQPGQSAVEAAVGIKFRGCCLGSVVRVFGGFGAGTTSMSSKLNVETFVAVLKKSVLVDPERLKKVIAGFTPTGGDGVDATPLVEFLISNNTITRWQSEKLLQGKHKGYFLGKYRLLSLLGKGGMSSVYLAEHTLMRRRCALKVLPTKRVHDSSYLARFHREAQAVASLDHPNIVRAYDVDHQADRENEIHFLVMEYVEGDSLQELVQKHGVCSFLNTAEYMRQSALGLHAAHEAGMVHRDVKPGNLLVDLNGTVKVLDLGLARFFTGEEEGESLTVAHDEKVLGTADYLAPEQALDSHTVDARADIYGLGCTMFFLLTGRPPFIEGTLTQRLMAHQTKTPPTIESLRPETPASLAAILRTMMAKKAEDRYPTAKATADALFEWVDDNADNTWRAAHSAIYGASRSKSGGSSLAAVPVAQPVIAHPVAALPMFDFTVSPAPSTRIVAPASNATAKSAPPQAVATESVESELSNFFDSISGAMPIPVSPPVESRKAPSSKKLKPPPHLTSLSAIKPAAPAAEQTVISTPDFTPAQPVVADTFPAETEHHFPDFGEMTSNFVASEPVLPPVAAAPVAKPVPAKPVIKSATSPPKKLSAATLLGVAGGGLALLLVVAFSRGWLGSFDWLESGASTARNEPKTKWPASKREITVGGAKAEYKTIVEALRAVRLRYEPTGPDDQMVIKIAAGTYKEFISVDASQQKTSSKQKSSETALIDWPHGIKLKGAGAVILEPLKESPKESPVIRLKEIPKFVVEGIDVNAAGHTSAIELLGYMNDTTLRAMTIRGFTESGVACRGALGSAFGTLSSDEIVMEQLRLEPAAGATGAAGIRLREDPKGDSSYLIVRGCRFLGPMSAGIVMSGTAPYKITIAENLFHQTQDGIRLEGPNVAWKDIVVSNNTFHAGNHGVLFARMPSEHARELIFRRNLFSKMEVADGLVKFGYEEGPFNGAASREPHGLALNFSDRAAVTPPQPGEINGLFSQDGKRGDKEILFVSDDPKSPQFLAPAENSVQRKVDLTADTKQKLSFEQPWVGAIGP